MPYRSPARFLAPLALALAVLTIIVVALPELGGSSSDTSSSSGTTPTTNDDGEAPEGATPTTRRTTPAAKKAPAKTYTVQPGDNPGSIAERTGVPVEDLLEFNDVDAQSLRVGQKLKLTP